MNWLLTKRHRLRNPSDESYPPVGRAAVRQGLLHLLTFIAQPIGNPEIDATIREKIQNIARQVGSHKKVTHDGKLFVRFEMEINTAPPEPKTDDAP